MKRPAQLLCQLCCSILLIFPLSINAAKTSKEYFQIKVYHYEDASQADRIESFLEHAFVPAVHRAGIENVGVFKPIENPEASDNRIFVLIPFKTLDQFRQLDAKLNKDKVFRKTARLTWMPPLMILPTSALRPYCCMPSITSRNPVYPT